MMQCIIMMSMMWLVRDRNCNKRISYAGPETSAGRPGNTPSRRRLACDITIKDSCAGQDRSAGRPGIRPFGASSAACPFPITACSGPYGTAYVQPHHTGPNTREETSALASSTTELPQHPDSTIQHHASSSRRHAAEDRASPVTVALHPRKPPYFYGGLDEDVYVWTSIVSHWFEYRSGRALEAVDIRGVTAERSSLLMVSALRDAYWVSRRLDNTASRHAGALWFVNSCKKGTSWFTTAEARQDDCLAVC